MKGLGDMDVRTITTKRRIQEGLFNLLKVREFTKCNVNEIVEYAEISKRTFYAYYKGKHDLLNTIETQLLKGLKENLAIDREKLTQIKHIPSAEEINKLADIAFNNTIAYCNRNKTAFSGLLSQNGDIYFYKKVVKLGNQEINNRFPYLFQEEMETENSLTLRFIRNIYVHGIIDILVLWGNSNNSIGIDDVKRLLGLVQTKSPVELMKLYQIEMDRFH